MVQKGQVYKCNVCGNMVEILYAGGGQLVCCGQPMQLLEERTQDEGKEKHVPVIEEQPQGIKVKVGSIPHPMEEAHYIQWIEVMTESGSFRKYLNPGQTPEAEFPVSRKEVLTVREYCNIHGLWRS
jgi:superoxide reductase